MQENNQTFYHILPNGLKIVQRTTQSQVIYVGLMVGVGTRHELPDENGIAHYIEHCVFKGTEHFTARQIIRNMEGTGGEINAYTTKEETTFYAATLQQHFRSTLHMLCDMVRRPTFPKKETDKELGVILDEIESYNDSPSELIYDDFESLVFQGSSLALPILGTKKTLRHISRSAAAPLAFMAQHYRPERTVLFVLGNIPPKNLVSLAERELSDWSSSSPLAPRLSTLDSRLSTLDSSPLASTITYRKHTHQTHLMIGARAYALGHPNQLTLYLLNNILGGGSLSSRLNMSLREQRGLVYTVESLYTPLSDTGYWNIYAACEPPHKDRCLELIRRELLRLRQTPLSSLQCQRALRQLQGQMAISAENQENNALSMAKNMLYHGSAPLWQETFQRMLSITPHDLLEVANECYNPDHFSLLLYQ